MIALAAAALALAAQIAPERAPPRRYLEVDLGPAGEPDPAPLPLPELAAALAAGSFEGVVLWLPPEDARAPNVPLEPRCWMLAEGAAPPEALAPIVDPFRAQDRRIAVGRRALADIAAIAPAPAERTLVIERPGAEPLRLRRVARPAMRRLLYSLDPAEEREPEGEGLDGLALSTRTLRSSDPALQVDQLRLDLGTSASASPAIARQSAFADALARRLAAGSADAFLPFENEWRGEPPPSERPPLRRGAAALDLEEWCFSDAALLARLLGPTPPDGDWIGGAHPADPASSDPEASGPVRTGALSSPQLTAFRALVNAHFAASSAWLRHMTRGDPVALAECRARLADAELALTKLPELAREWRATLALDLALVEQSEPWRIRFTRFRVAAPDAGLDPTDVTLARVDDPRLGAWASPLEDALGGKRIDLWKLLRPRAGLEVTLRSDLQLRDPRNVRLRVDAPARRALRVNGAPLLEGFESSRGPLLTTLPLPAGASTIELALTLDGGGGAVELDLSLLPQRVEGIVLEPERASRVHEPVVRLHDPTALGETCLVRPAGRVAPSSASGGGTGARATLPFSLGTATRLDLWIHALPPPQRGGRLDLRLDDGPARALELPTGSTWAWLRAPAPATVAAGDHALHLEFPDGAGENVRVDQAVLMPSELTFPRTPAGESMMPATTWRFDPLGSGLVLDVPAMKSGELRGRAFSLDHGGSYDVFVWLKGSDPLPPGRFAQLDIESSAGKQRFVLPAGTPHEEWVALGSVLFVADDRIELSAQGWGALARVAFVR